MNILTIDIGGTEIKSAVYNEQSQLLVDFDNQSTRVSSHDNAIAEQVVDLIKAAQTRLPLDGVAIATAGVVDTQAGKIIHAGPTIPNYRGTDFKHLVAKHVGLPCVVENDVNAMAVAECALLDNVGSAFCITIGTGLGGAVIINGKLWRGHHFSAGEIGCIPVSDDSRDNKRLEEVASTTALLRHYGRLSGQRVNGKAFFKQLQQGDELAKAAFEQTMSALARGLCAPLCLFAPEVLIIGGGIAKQGSIISDAVKRHLQKQLTSEYFLPERICTAQLGNRAGMLGALRLFLAEHQGSQ